MTCKPCHGVSVRHTAKEVCVCVCVVLEYMSHTVCSRLPPLVGTFFLTTVFNNSSTPLCSPILHPMPPRLNPISSPTTVITISSPTTVLLHDYNNHFPLSSVVTTPCFASPDQSLHPVVYTCVHHFFLTLYCRHHLIVHHTFFLTSFSFILLYVCVYYEMFA